MATTASLTNVPLNWQARPAGERVIMVNSEHDKPTNFIGLYFVDEGGSETGRIIAQVSDGYYL
jgi:hypothetical protein